MASQAALSDTAKIAHRAFVDMRQSKQLYFELLQTLDQKYKTGGAASIAENLQLEQLLKSHDENVTAFNHAMQAVNDKADREALIRLMS